jgi:hypothetical protein
MTVPRLSGLGHRPEGERPYPHSTCVVEIDLCVGRCRGVLGFTCPFRIGPSITEYDLMGLWRMVDWLRLRWELRHVKLPDPPPRPTLYGLADGELLVGDYRIASFGHDEVRLLAVLQDQAITFTSERIGYSEMIITMPGRHVPTDSTYLAPTDRPQW